MAKLGRKQLDMLALIGGVQRAIVVPDAVTRSLCKRGLMTSGGTKTDGFLVLTSAGYRAIADAMDSGDITRQPVEEWNKRKAR